LKKNESKKNKKTYVFKNGVLSVYDENKQLIIRSIDAIKKKPTKTELVEIAEKLIITLELITQNNK
jgi:hypothetical protein